MVKITSAFWGRYRQLVRKEMLPYQWGVLNDELSISIEKERNEEGIPNEKSHAFENFRIAAGKKAGEHYGMVFQDSDVYKWLEAAAYSLREEMDPEIFKHAEETVKLIGEAQEPDGYLNTYFSIGGLENRYKRLGESHELYCAGHFLEAAVAYYETSKNAKVLEIAEKLANHLCETFGEGEGKNHGYDGHEEIEIGLLRLYHLTKKEAYYELARFFLLQRGKNPNYFKEENEKWKTPVIFPGMESLPQTYSQNHKPVLEQEAAEGHAVRFTYLCIAMADVAATKGDQEFVFACERLWRNMVDKRMYITGGIGSTVIGESFSTDYDLPNDTMYCETCAAVGVVFFAKQMLRFSQKGEYADVMERSLYNGALAGMALDGKHFFYVNPLEVRPKQDLFVPTKGHVKAVRPEWLGCACCPPNLARLLASMESCVYTTTEQGVWLHLFVDSRAEFTLPGGKVTLVQRTEYPRNGKVTLEVSGWKGTETLGIRMPQWAGDFSFTCDGVPAKGEKKDGYFYPEIQGESFVLNFEIPFEIKKWYSNPKVSGNVGKVALSRGPFIYCMEGVDNGEDLHRIFLPQKGKMQAVEKKDILGGVTVLEVEGVEVKETQENRPLYGTEPPELEQKTCYFIPYYAWANRGENEMRVWINTR